MPYTNALKFENMAICKCAWEDPGNAEPARPQNVAKCAIPTFASGSHCACVVHKQREHIYYR